MSPRIHCGAKADEGYMITGESMLIAAINSANAIDAKQKIQQTLNLADGIELRLDYWQELDLKALAELRKSITIPVIFTLRKKSQGGSYQHDENTRLKDILALCQLNPDYLDLEDDIPSDFLKQIHENFPAIKLICSHHNFNETPADLNKILQAMLNPYSHIYKIAAKANCAIDMLRMLQFIKNHQTKYKIAGMSMGEFGCATRIIAPIIGGELTYASLTDNHATAPGQITLQELNDIYHYRKLNQQTQIYALLGDPVDKSVGHLWHNQAFQMQNKNAVYIKMRVLAHEVQQVLQACRTLPFFGFSVTMPLKELVFPAIDNIEQDAKKIGAINSIALENNFYSGFNTDGVAAIDVLMAYLPDINNKKIIILGAGGAARALIYIAKQRGAEVIVLNRTFDKAKKLATEFNCKALELQKLMEIKEQGYDAIINTLPYSAQEKEMQLFILDNFIAGTVAMDIVYNPAETPFLVLARQAGCQCIYGYEMFNRQAALQEKRWFNLNPVELKHLERYTQATRK